MLSAKQTDALCASACVTGAILASAVNHTHSWINVLTTFVVYFFTRWYLWGPDAR